MISTQQLGSMPAHLPLESRLLAYPVANSTQFLQFVPPTREVLEPVSVYVLLAEGHADRGQLRLPLLWMRVDEDLRSSAFARPMSPMLEFVIAPGTMEREEKGIFFLPLSLCIFVALGPDRALPTLFVLGRDEEI